MARPPRYSQNNYNSNSSTYSTVSGATQSSDTGSMALTATMTTLNNTLLSNTMMLASLATSILGLRNVISMMSVAGSAAKMAGSAGNALATAITGRSMSGAVGMLARAAGPQALATAGAGAALYIGFSEFSRRQNENAVQEQEATRGEAGTLDQDTIRGRMNTIHDQQQRSERAIYSRREEQSLRGNRYMLNTMENANAERMSKLREDALAEQQDLDKNIRRADQQHETSRAQNESIIASGGANYAESTRNNFGAGVYNWTIGLGAKAGSMGLQAAGYQKAAARWAKASVMSQKLTLKDRHGNDVQITIPSASSQQAQDQLKQEIIANFDKEQQAQKSSAIEQRQADIDRRARDLEIEAEKDNAVIAANEGHAALGAALDRKKGLRNIATGAITKNTALFSVGEQLQATLGSEFASRADTVEEDKSAALTDERTRRIKAGKPAMSEAEEIAFTKQYDEKMQATQTAQSVVGRAFDIASQSVGHSDAFSAWQQLSDQTSVTSQQQGVSQVLPKLDDIIAAIQSGKAIDPADIFDMNMGGN